VARRLKFDIPGPDWRVEPEAVAAKGWEALFTPDLQAPFRFVVELGFGRAEFLMDRAALDPAAAHVGVDYSFKRVLRAARRLARTELRNVRLIHAPAEFVVRELLDPDSVDVFWINFSDPWPKKRHHRRRLIQPSLVAELALRLRPGAMLHAATDHPAYAEAIDAALHGEASLENAYAPAPYLQEVPGRRATAYELEWRREGRELFFWAYRRRDTRAPSASVDSSGTPP
jgi:tRNA (guanine-N7-)-methyltransferase